MIGLRQLLSRERYTRDDAMIALGAPGRVVSVGGRKVHYVARGSGPAVVLVHGFFYHTFMWRETIAALEKRFTCYALDLFGFGWSEKPRAPEEIRYGYELWAEQIAGFMDALKLERAHLVGQSLGAGAIMAFAAKRPERAGSIVLICPAGIPNPLAKKGEKNLLLTPVLGELVVKLPGLAVPKKVLRDFFISDPAKVTDEYAAEVVRPTAIHGSADAQLWIMRNVDLGGIEDRVRAFGERRLRSLVLWGRQDAAIPVGNAERYREIVRPERVVILEGAGHVPHHEQPEAAHHEILDFLTAREAATAAVGAAAAAAASGGSAA